MSNAVWDINETSGCPSLRQWILTAQSFEVKKMRKKGAIVRAIVACHAYNLIYSEKDLRPFSPHEFILVG